MLAMPFAGGVASCVLIGCYRYLAIRYQWLDHPNDRSSHRTLVPRGAGIVFALLITAAAIVHLSGHPLLPISFVAVFAIALIGWWDDLWSIPARYRFGLYWLSAAITSAAVYPELLETAFSQPIRAVLALLAVSLSLVWLTNLYNFMDGINGIAGFEAVFVLGAILWLGSGSDFDYQLRPLLWLALLVVAGFLLWNFPVAKVFMGDAGSAYLGALIGLFILWSQRLDGPSLLCWLTLLGIFVVDTAYTLVVRIITGQRWYTAHRTHAYQLLNDRLHSHAQTVLIVSTINLFWLLPWAWLARNGGWTGASATIIAYVPLVAGCYKLKAGIPARAAV